MAQSSIISQNLQKVQELIRLAEKRASRNAGSVSLLAVSKFHSADCVLQAFNAGQILFGENRVQEAKKKFSVVNDEILKSKEKNPLQLHIIGSLQRNKVRDAVKIADVIESIDRLELLYEIEKQAAKIQKKIELFFELKTGEESKSGYKTQAELFESLFAIKNENLLHCVPRGIFTMAPNTKDENLIRESFKKAKSVFENAKNEFPEFDFCVLSMGMSGDFEIAIEEGSTQVRIGTAIFGERNL